MESQPPNQSNPQDQSLYSGSPSLPKTTSPNEALRDQTPRNPQLDEKCPPNPSPDLQTPLPPRQDNCETSRCSHTCPENGAANTQFGPRENPFCPPESNGRPFPFHNGPEGRNYRSQWSPDDYCVEYNRSAMEEDPWAYWESRREPSMVQTPWECPQYFSPEDHVYYGSIDCEEGFCGRNPPCGDVWQGECEIDYLPETSEPAAPTEMAPVTSSAAPAAPTEIAPVTSSAAPAAPTEMAPVTSMAREKPTEAVLPISPETKLPVQTTGPSAVLRGDSAPEVEKMCRWGEYQSTLQIPSGFYVQIQPPSEEGPRNEHFGKVFVHYNEKEASPTGETLVSRRRSKSEGVSKSVKKANLREIATKMKKKGYRVKRVVFTKD